MSRISLGLNGTLSDLLLLMPMIENADTHSPKFGNLSKMIPSFLVEGRVCEKRFRYFKSHFLRFLVRRLVKLVYV